MAPRIVLAGCLRLAVFAFVDPMFRTERWVLVREGRPFCVELPLPTPSV